MTKKVINTVQDYLTVVEENRCYQIVNVELLLRRHPGDAVVAFLNELRKEYSKKLGNLIKNNKTDPKINELVIKTFRVKMAIHTLKNANKEVKDVAA